MKIVVASASGLRNDAHNQGGKDPAERQSKMKASSALQAAQEFGGWNLGQDAGIDEQEIRAYFTEENFTAMFPGEDATECGGYSLEECAEAVIEWQREASNV